MDVDNGVIMYKRCETCVMPHRSEKDKEMCSLYWRPHTGTKAGFPTKDGWSCPLDTYKDYVEKYGVPDKSIFKDARGSLIDIPLIATDDK